MLLLLLFGLPIIGMILGIACYNLEKTNTLVAGGMEQLHIMFSNTRFYDNSTQCEMDPLCKTGVDTFYRVLALYLDPYISNITLAGTIVARCLSVCLRERDFRSQPVAIKLMARLYRVCPP